MPSWSSTTGITKGVVGHKFSIGAVKDDKIVGVVIAGYESPSRNGRLVANVIGESKSNGGRRIILNVCCWDTFFAPTGRL